MCFLFVSLVLVIYVRTFRFDYINYDDQDYVTENLVVQKGITVQGLKWAFSFVDNDLTYWHPLAYIAHMVDCQLFGIHPGYHHLSNVFVHTLNVLMFFFACCAMTGAFYRSAFAACLFAVHPMAVDSVVWIAQKKNLLATFFWLTTVLAYAWYAQRTSVRRYACVCLAIAAGLLTKPVMVTIPVVLFILDLWPLGRFERFAVSEGVQKEKKNRTFPLKWLIIEKIPFMFLVGLWGITPFIPEHVTAKNISLEAVPLFLRYKNAVVSYAVYVKKYIWPFDLTILYPYPEEVSTLLALGVTVVIIAVSVAALRFIRTIPYAAAGWFVFLICLVPFLGFVQGAVWPAYADRFAYVPYIGIHVAFAWGFHELTEHLGLQKWLKASIAGGLIIFMAATAFHQTGYWKNNISLYTHALDVTAGNYLAHNNLGVAYDEQGQSDAAKREYGFALAIKPGFSKAHHNLAVNLLKQGDTDTAVYHFMRSIASNPFNPVAKYNLAAIAMGRGHMDDAMGYYQSAISDKPDFSDAYNNLGVLLSARGKKKEAAEHFRHALIYDPGHANALSNLGNELFDAGRYNDAMVCFSRALSLDSKNVRALNDLGVLYAAMGKPAEAESCFKNVMEIEPGNATAQRNLALIAKEKQQFDKKFEMARHDAKRYPKDQRKLMIFGDLCVLKGDIRQAETLFQKVLAMNPVSEEALLSLASMYEKTAQYAKAIVYYTRLAENHELRKAEAYYNIACLFSLENRGDEAVKWLQSAGDAGFNNWKRLKEDTRLDRIRKTKSFQEFISLTESITQ